MNAYYKSQQAYLRKHYHTLVELGLPTDVLDDWRAWCFFLQEGWVVETGWHYQTELSLEQQQQLYAFLKRDYPKANLVTLLALQLSMD